MEFGFCAIDGTHVTNVLYGIEPSNVYRSVSAASEVIAKLAKNGGKLNTGIRKVYRMFTLTSAV